MTADEVAMIANGTVRANHLDPVWHMTLEGDGGGVASVGEIGLTNTTGQDGHVTTITNPPVYYRDPPLHWPDEGPMVPRYNRRQTLNTRQTHNVSPGTGFQAHRNPVARRAI